jgi:hypothetical protein
LGFSSVIAFICDVTGSFWGDSLFSNSHADVNLTHAARQTEILAKEHGDSVFMRFDEPIHGGTSGGPVIDENGFLVSVISWSSEGRDTHGSVPRPQLALPVWIVKRIMESPRWRDDESGREAAE